MLGHVTGEVVPGAPLAPAAGGWPPPAPPTCADVPATAPVPAAAGAPPLPAAGLTTAPPLPAAGAAVPVPDAPALRPAPAEVPAELTGDVVVPVVPAPPAVGVAGGVPVPAAGAAVPAPPGEVLDESPHAASCTAKTAHKPAVWRAKEWLRQRMARASWDFGPARLARKQLAAPTIFAAVDGCQPAATLSFFDARRVAVRSGAHAESSSSSSTLTLRVAAPVGLHLAPKTRANSFIARLGRPTMGMEPHAPRPALNSSEGKRETIDAVRVVSAVYAAGCGV